ncbi:H/ACA ribonucleoprotein complex subunit GAR1 [Halobellus ruber]|uniref:H/ACA RNA-protein complex component Gar1 n=1 Tax=Halobellus ruber TaxID=2761102 RepID=A0A7J9SG22_9EURY|nr:Gar1/Naf1 family protein [Halobellus ruber]MBB6645668.1 H/ACA RNA-protein complex component Gar1 [Halobellus ruber]
MQRLGTVSRTAQNLLIVRCDDSDRPDIGATAVDESLSRVGRVVDVFGPVSRPYVAVTPAEGVRAASLVGDRLYAK